MPKYRIELWQTRSYTCVVDEAEDSAAAYEQAKEMVDEGDFEEDSFEMFELRDTEVIG